MCETIYIVPGARIDSLNGFYRVIGEVINGPGGYFGANLDAFADCLRGDFGTPDGSYVLRWVDSDYSRATLGYHETARWLAERAHNAQPTSRVYFAAHRAQAEQG